MVMGPNLPIQLALNKWSIIAVDRFQEQLVKLNIGEVDGALMRSFTHQVIANGGDAWTVLIRFLKYGRFVDMGVGRSHKLGSLDGSRVPKKWYGKVKTRETAVLRFIVTKTYSAWALRQLETELKSIDKRAA
jgi:hypothetical protein